MRLIDLSEQKETEYIRKHFKKPSADAKLLVQLYNRKVDGPLGSLWKDRFIMIKITEKGKSVARNLKRKWPELA